MKKKIADTLKKKKGVKFIKIRKLSKADLAKVNMDDLWIISPGKGIPSVRARLCGCRSVCLA